jgi:hypothetical protein
MISVGPGEGARRVHAAHAVGPHAHVVGGLARGGVVALRSWSRQRSFDPVGRMKAEKAPAGAERAVETVNRVDRLPVQGLFHPPAVGVPRVELSARPRTGSHERSRRPAGDGVGLAGRIIAEPVHPVRGDIAPPVIKLVTPGEAGVSLLTGSIAFARPCYTLHQEPN